MRKTLTIAARLSGARSVLGGGFELALVVGLHLALVCSLATMRLRPPLAEDLARLDLRIVEDVLLPEKVAQKPKPLAVKLSAQPLPPSQASPPATPIPPARPLQPSPPASPAALVPVMTAAADATQAPATFTVSPQAKSAPPSDLALARAPTSLPAPVAPAPLAPTAIALTPARFDADYLHNPAPAYPRAARRYGDQGRVLLKVLVSANGTASAVQIQTSSGYARLDEAAEETVRQWRFVPARRGAESIEDWVLVPVVFRLDS